MVLNSVFCISNIDCKSLTVTTICKEAIPYGAKLCQPSTSCTQACSSGFCDAANICQDGKVL